MQLMPQTAAYMGVDPAKLKDPEQNIAAGAAYLSYLFQTAWKRYKLKGVRFHDVPQWLVQRIIAAYNAGPRFLFRDDFYAESRAYVRKVLLFYQSQVTDLRRRPQPAHPALALPSAALN
jgi:soluble lytic murein transglycosylase-like protein